MRAFLLALLLAGCDSARPASAPNLDRPRDNLAPVQLAAWHRGHDLFTREFTPADGLGPAFNDASCATCHALPTIGGSGGLDHTAALGPDPMGAPDVVAYRRHLVGAPDPAIPQGASLRAAPPLYGIADLETVPVACGGSGRVIRDSQDRVLRLGFKPFARTVEGFVRDALFAEMGLTSGTATDEDGVPDPEVAEDAVSDLTAYLSGLAPVERRGAHPAGEALFMAAGCATCHPANSLWSDAPCVHDLGAALGDGVTDKASGPRDWRTAPLRGLRHRPHFLRHGAAATVDEAIRMHGGEAQAARDRYVDLSDGDRAAIRAFLETL